MYNYIFIFQAFCLKMFFGKGEFYVLYKLFMGRFKNVGYL